MTYPDSEQRSLSYPLRDNYEKTPFGTDDSTAVFLDLSEWQAVDSETRVKLVFEWSLEEFVKIATSVDVGRDIAYNSNSGNIWWTWVRGLVSMSICDDVADCIETSDAVATALASALVNNSVVNSALQQAIRDSSLYNSNGLQPLPDGALQQNLIDPSSLCTDENRYAMALTAVRAMDTLAVDFLQIIEVLTNPNEIASQIAGSIPVFGGGAQLTLETANWLQDNIADNYNAAYTPTTERNIACQIYCNMDGNCELSIDSLIQAYYDVATITPPTSQDFASTMSWLIANVTPSLDDVVVAAMHTFVLYVVKWTNDWLGVNVFDYVKQEMYNARDESVLVPAECECANSWCIRLSGNELEARIFNSQPLGTLVGGQWQSVSFNNAPAWRRTVQILAPNDSYNLTSVTMNFDLTKGTYSNISAEPSYGFSLAEGAALTALVLNGAASNGANQTWSVQGNWNVNGRLEFVVAADRQPTQAQLTGFGGINWIEITGTGLKPSWGSEC